jgi:hypothetical protein
VRPAATLEGELYLLQCSEAPMPLGGLREVNGTQRIRRGSRKAATKLIAPGGNRDAMTGSAQRETAYAASGGSCIAATCSRSSRIRSSQ